MLKIECVSIHKLHDCYTHSYPITMAPFLYLNVVVAFCFVTWLVLYREKYTLGS